MIQKTENNCRVEGGETEEEIKRERKKDGGRGNYVINLNPLQLDKCRLSIVCIYS